MYSFAPVNNIRADQSCFVVTSPEDSFDFFIMQFQTNDASVERVECLFFPFIEHKFYPVIESILNNL